MEEIFERRPLKNSGVTSDGRIWWIEEYGIVYEDVEDEYDVWCQMEHDMEAA